MNSRYVGDSDSFGCARTHLCFYWSLSAKAQAPEDRTARATDQALVQSALSAFERHDYRGGSVAVQASVGQRAQSHRSLVFGSLARRDGAARGRRGGLSQRACASAEAAEVSCE